MSLFDCGIIIEEMAAFCQYLWWGDIAPPCGRREKTTVYFCANMRYNFSVGSDLMTDYQKLEALAQADGGVLTTAAATEAGISKTALANFVSQRKYERVSLGVYLSPDAWRDDAYLLQMRCPQIIFSHDSALFYHDLTDREPLQFTVTAKTGYNPTHLTSNGVKVFTIKKELYKTGIVVAGTSYGHKVRVYNMERTICDILRSRSSMETQVFYDALKQYARRRDKNLHILMDYAKLFHVEKMVRQYMGVLLS